MSKLIRVLCFGDVVGRPGRELFASRVPGLVREREIDLVVVNAENASGGLGLAPDDADAFLASGASVITLGDHTWQNRELHSYLDRAAMRCIRPGNYPEGAPGSGCTVFETKSGVKVGLMNLIGRVFFNFALDCPFKKADRYLEQELSGCDVVICDMHAEATSEKVAMGLYLDGRASLVFGTHTHVQTADERLLPRGTAYISDLGMCGCYEGVIGMDAEVALQRLIGGVPKSYKVAKGNTALCGVYAELEGRGAKKIERVRVE